MTGLFNYSDESHVRAMVYLVHIEVMLMNEKQNQCDFGQVY